MLEGISEILPSAVGVAISPVPIVAVTLMLFSQRARVNGPAFLVGWVVALVIVSGVAYILADKPTPPQMAPPLTRSRGADRLRRPLPAARGSHLAPPPRARSAARAAEVDGGH